MVAEKSPILFPGWNLDSIETLSVRLHLKWPGEHRLLLYNITMIFIATEQRQPWSSCESINREAIAFSAIVLWGPAASQSQGCRLQKF